MMSYFSQIYGWLAPWIPLITAISLLLALVSLVLLPVLVVKMPADYFLPVRRRRAAGKIHIGYKLLRNMLAFLLFIAGTIMLFAPGQGLLTMLAAIMISDVPGKYKIERWIVLQPGVLRTINWIRKGYNRPPVKSPKSLRTRDSRGAHNG